MDKTNVSKITQHRKLNFEKHDLWHNYLAQITKLFCSTFLLPCNFLTFRRHNRSTVSTEKMQRASRRCDYKQNSNVVDTRMSEPIWCIIVSTDKIVVLYSLLFVNVNLSFKFVYALCMWHELINVALHFNDFSDFALNYFLKIKTVGIGPFDVNWFDVDQLSIPIQTYTPLLLTTDVLNKSKFKIDNCGRLGKILKPIKSTN